jgi:hypothetical protein
MAISRCVIDLPEKDVRTDDLDALNVEYSVQYRYNFAHTVPTCDTWRATRGSGIGHQRRQHTSRKETTLQAHITVFVGRRFFWDPSLTKMA